MTTPVVPAYLAPTVHPYVTPAQFSVYPTWLDLDDLVPGGAAQAIQSGVLADVLLAATAWAIDVVDGMPLHAHLDTRSTRCRTDAMGRVWVKPAHIPVRQVVSFSYGWDPTTMAALALPDASQWIEDGRVVSYLLSGSGLNFTGPAIQFGRGPTPDQTTYVQWTYAAGFVNTVLSGPVSAGASAVPLSDTTGVQPGDLLRIWDDTTGGSEAVTISPTWTPPAPTWPPTSASVPISGTLANNHLAGVGVADMPRDVMQSVVMCAVSLLMREDVSAEEPFAGSPYGPNARKSTSGGVAGGLVDAAERMLTKYRVTRGGN